MKKLKNLILGLVMAVTLSACNLASEIPTPTVTPTAEPTPTIQATQAPASELNFDPNKKGQWQRVETEFSIPSNAMYVVEFMYKGAESVNIDNVCVTSDTPLT